MNVPSMFIFNFKKNFSLYSAVLIILLMLSQIIYPVTRGQQLIEAQTTEGQSLKLYKSSHALLIGISDYTAGWPDLTAVPEELLTVKSALKLHQFEITSILDPSSTELEKGIKDFINEYGYESDSRLLIYFSGHGYSRGQKGYLVPSDAPNPQNNEKGFLKKALPMSQILAWSRQMEAKHVLFLFDSCFSGTVFQVRNLPDKPPHITRLTAKKVRQFITAGSAGEEVPAQSTFTPAFADGIGEVFIADMNKDGYVTGTELGLYLQGEVPKHVEQLPQFGKIRDFNLSRGDFVFVAPVKASVVTKESTTNIKISDEEGTADSLSHESQLKLMTCEVHLKANRLTTGRGGNALECYEQVLASDPDNSKALAGIKQIENKYAAWAESQINRGNLAKASSYLQKIEMINPESEQLTQLQAVMTENQLKQQTVEMQASFGKQAAQERKPSPGSITESVTGMELIKIPSGCFQMGSNHISPREKPIHRVCITQDFYLGKYEVTQGQWKAIMRRNPSKSKKGDNYPVEQISWDDIQEFIRKLNDRTGKRYRLPTEAEWEYACRSGGKEQEYCGGNNPFAVGWFDQELIKGPYAIGGKKPNGLGLYDMSGNVREWVQDWNGDNYYRSSPVNNPTGPSSGSHRVMRGGVWFLNEGYTRSSWRNYSEPSNRDFTFGFRLASTGP